MDPLPQAKHASTDDECVDHELPPLLLTLDIEGLPPRQLSKYVHEAEKLLRNCVERWQIVSFDTYCLVGLCSAGYMHPAIIGADRLVAIAIMYALAFILDDMLIDLPDEFLRDQYGIDPSARDSPDHMKEYLDNLHVIFSQESEPPCADSAPPIKMIVWELGRDMLRLSNPEWFRSFVAMVIVHHQAGVASHADIAAGHNIAMQGREAYCRMRAGNVGGRFAQLLTEFANNTYLPKEMRSHPFMQVATDAACLHIAFVNDVYSYHKESMQEGNPRNIITVLMESEGKSLAQAVQESLGLINSNYRIILDLESRALNPALQRHLQDIKELIAGNLFYSSSCKRYRQPDSVFPELRDTAKFTILGEWSPPSQEV